MASIGAAIFAICQYCKKLMRRKAACNATRAMIFGGDLAMREPGLWNATPMDDRTRPEAEKPRDPVYLREERKPGVETRPIPAPDEGPTERTRSPLRSAVLLVPGCADRLWHLSFRNDATGAAGRAAARLRGGATGRRGDDCDRRHQNRGHSARHGDAARQCDRENAGQRPIDGSRVHGRPDRQERRFPRADRSAPVSTGGEPI